MRFVTLLFLPLFTRIDNASAFQLPETLSSVSQWKGIKRSPLLSIRFSAQKSDTSIENIFKPSSPWEAVALQLFNIEEDPSQISSFVQCVSALRVSIPALALAASAKIAYTPVSLALAEAINDSASFAVISMDASQFIQNILTTSGLVFALLQGQTYYFMYQQRKFSVE